MELGEAVLHQQEEQVQPQNRAPHLRLGQLQRPVVLWRELCGGRIRKGGELGVSIPICGGVSIVWRSIKERRRELGVGGEHSNLGMSMS